jgi:N-acetylmuramic acid 6-phosphate etherase
LGKVYENLMVDLRASNTKLWDRAARIVSTLTGLSRDDAMNQLKAADGHVKLAVVMHKRNLTADQAKALLEQAGGRLRKALE